MTVRRYVSAYVEMEHVLLVLCCPSLLWFVRGGGGGGVSPLQGAPTLRILGFEPKAEGGSRACLFHTGGSPW